MEHKEVNNFITIEQAEKKVIYFICDNSHQLKLSGQMSTIYFLMTQWKAQMNLFQIKRGHAFKHIIIEEGDKSYFEVRKHRKSIIWQRKVMIMKSLRSRKRWGKVLFAFWNWIIPYFISNYFRFVTDASTKKTYNFSS